MPVNQISICNSALIKVGADRISSITQDTRSAVLLNAIWDQVRDAVLRAHPWNFAIKRVTLNPTGTAPEYEYDYAFDLPNDCLRVLEHQYNDVDFIVENGQILTDEATFPCRYIYRNDDPSDWDACFAEALSWRLARELAYAITQSSTLADQCEKSYMKALAEARSMDGTEGVIKGLVSDEWTNARRSGRSV